MPISAIVAPPFHSSERNGNLWYRLMVAWLHRQTAQAQRKSSGLFTSHNRTLKEYAHWKLPQRKMGSEETANWPLRLGIEFFSSDTPSLSRCQLLIFLFHNPWQVNLSFIKYNLFSFNLNIWTRYRCIFGV